MQRRDPNSLLNWMEPIIHMRKEVPEVGWGDFSIVPTRHPAVLAVRCDWRNNSVLFVHHFADTPCEVNFSVSLADRPGRRLINLLSEDHSHARNDGKHHLILEPYGYRWYRVGGVDYLLQRGDLD